MKQSSPEIVVVCLEHLDEECRKRVTECSKKWDSGGVQKFYKELAMLKESIQDKCLVAILDKLTSMSREGAKLVKESLEKGNTRTSNRNFRTRSSCCCSCCCWHCCYVDNLLHVIRRLPSNNFFSIQILYSLFPLYPTRVKVHYFIFPGRDKVLKRIDQETMVLVSCDENASKQWRSLARELQVKDAVIDAIEEERAQNFQECCHQSLVKWQQINGSAATIRKLLRALIQERLHDVALKLSNKLMESGDGQH